MSIDYVFPGESRLEIFSTKIQASYSLDDRYDELSDYFTIVNGNSEKLLPSKYRKMLNWLNLDSGFAKFLPKHVFRDHIRDVVSLVGNIAKDPNNLNYLESYLEIRNFLLKLDTPKINRRKLLDLANSQKHDGPKNSIMKFVDKKYGDFAPRTKYSNYSTATGRLTVIEGPNVLTVPAETRSCLKSSFRDGKIIQIDIIAAEPKFAAYVNQSQPPADIYDDISTKVFDGKLTRLQVKIATLCALYGQSASRLATSLPAGLSATSVISSVKEYFGCNNLLKKLRDAYSTGTLRNHLGRPLNPSDENLLVSYFLQSSVAEASIVMFSNFCKNNPEVKPYYVIHDALLLDAPGDFLKNYKNNDVIDLFYNNWRFESKITFMDNI